MHHIYHTEGIILESRNQGEAGRYYAIFTRDLGMIYASASGVRKASSKLRYVLQDFAYLKIDLVRGKDFWRITSASKTNSLESLHKNKEIFPVFYQISKLLKRLLAGEEANESLFQDLIKGLHILEETKGKKEIENVEVVIVLRILANLGYLGRQDSLEHLIASPVADDLIFEVAKNRTAILSEINKALKETQL